MRFSVHKTLYSSKTDHNVKWLRKHFFYLLPYVHIITLFNTVLFVLYITDKNYIVYCTCINHLLYVFLKKQSVIGMNSFKTEIPPHKLNLSLQDAR